MKENFIFFMLVTLILDAKSEVTDEEYYSMPPLFHLDDFDHCMSLREEALYCSLTIQLSPLYGQNQSNTWRIIEKVSGKKKNYRHDRIRHGICVPLSCPDLSTDITFYRSNKESLKEKISKCYTEKYKNYELDAVVTDMHCEINEHFYKVDVYDILVAISLVSLALFVTFATFYEGLPRYKSKEEYERITRTKTGEIICCFSLIKNWERLQSPSSSPDAASLKGINGMRFYSMFLVIATHVCMITLAGPIFNPKFTENITDNPMNMIFLNGSYLVQTFLFMAGWLLCYNFLLAFEGRKRKKVKLKFIFFIFLHRYIRLTPSLLVTIALNATWMYHMGRGPTWDSVVGKEYRNCRQNWWTNLLYINNYYNAKDMCLQQSWYLATDTQLFLVSLIIIAFMCNRPKFYKLILGVSLAVGILIPGVINYVMDYDIVIRQYPETLYKFFLENEQWHMMYSSGYTNLGGYVVGIIFGYIFYKSRGKKVFTSKLQVLFWWITVWSLPLGMIFLGVPIYETDSKPTPFLSAVYAALGRNLFALGIAFALFGITQNVGWFLRDCVLWQPLQVLGRLTYSAYLVHTLLIRVQHGQIRTLVYVSEGFFLNETLNQLINSYVAALILSLFVELPISALQKLMLPQEVKKGTEAPDKLEGPVIDSMFNTNENTIVSKV